MLTVFVDRGRSQSSTDFRPILEFFLQGCLDRAIDHASTPVLLQLTRALTFALRLTIVSPLVAEGIVPGA